MRSLVDWGECEVYRVNIKATTRTKKLLALFFLLNIVNIIIAITLEIILAVEWNTFRKVNVIELSLSGEN